MNETETETEGEPVRAHASYPQQPPDMRLLRLYTGEQAERENECRSRPVLGEPS